MRYDLVDTSILFVDATHVKAAANRKKSKKVLVAKRAARFYDEQLKNEINADRETHGKKPLKSKDDDEEDGNTPSGPSSDLKEKKESTTDPESGWFHKGEHKEEFAYAVEAAWILYIQAMSTILKLSRQSTKKSRILILQ